jgi:metal-responsive CopG/Arc/MetJ family transcriptional regulator
MEIKSRGVDPVAVKKIDELAKNQGISRSAFVANLIQNYSALEEFKDFEERYQSFIQKCMTVIDKNTKVMQDILNIVGDQE